MAKIATLKRRVRALKIKRAAARRRVTVARKKVEKAKAALAARTMDAVNEAARPIGSWEPQFSKVQLECREVEARERARVRDVHACLRALLAQAPPGNPNGMIQLGVSIEQAWALSKVLQRHGY